MRITHVRDEYGWHWLAGFAARHLSFALGSCLVLVVVVACGYSNAQTAPNVEDTVGVNVNFQDFFPWLSENFTTSCLTPLTSGCSFFQNTGIKWVRTDFEWQDVETILNDVDFTSCQYDSSNITWTHCIDAFVNILNQLSSSDAVNPGVYPYFILDYSNSLHAPNDEDDDCPPPQGNGTAPGACVVVAQTTVPFFQIFASKALNTYAGRGFKWELWNEPNDSDFWPTTMQYKDQVSYPSFALAVSQALNGAYPNEYLVGPAYASESNLYRCGGPFPTGDESVSISAVETLLGQPSALQYWKGLSAHFYRGPAPETVNDCDLENLESIVGSTQYNPTGKSIDLISSEWGYSTLQPAIPGTSQDVSEYQQAEYLSRMWLYNAALGVRYSIWYDWHDTAANQRNGLVRYQPIPPLPNGSRGYAPYTSGDSYTPKPAYYAATAIVGLAATPPAAGTSPAPVPVGYLRGFHFENEIPSPGNIILAFTNAKGSETRYAAWTTSSTPVQYTLYPAVQGQYLVISNLGSILSFNTVGSDGLQLTLTEAPQLVLSPQSPLSPVAFAVDEIFNQVLGRPPSPSEFTTYSSQLTGGTSVSSIVTTLALGAQSAIISLYTGYLPNNAPTAHQLACSTMALENGTSWLALVDTIRAYPPPAAPSLTSVLAEGYDHVYYANCSPQVNQFTWNGSIWSTFNPSTWAASQLMTNPTPPQKPQSLQPAECSNAANYPACPPNVSSTSVPVEVGTATIGEAANGLTSLLSGTSDHLEYIGADQHVWELWWSGSDWEDEDLTQSAGLSITAAPGSALTSLLYPGNEDHVEFIGNDQHVHEFWYNPSIGWETTDLTGQTGAPLAASPSALTSLLYPGNEDHVEYIGSDEHVHEFWYNGSIWQTTDLTAQTGAPNAATPSALTSLLYPGSEDHVEYIGSDQHVHQFWYNGTWHTTDLTAQTGAPLAASPGALTSLLYNGNQDHVEFIGSDNHVHEFWYNGSIWQTTDLTAQTGAPLAASPSALTSLLFPGNEDHVEYVGVDQHVHEFWYNGSIWQTTDLTAQTGAPL